MDLLELDHELARVRNVLDSWVDQKQQSALEARDSHAAFLHDQHGIEMLMRVWSVPEAVSLPPRLTLRAHLHHLPNA